MAATFLSLNGPPFEPVGRFGRLSLERSPPIFGVLSFIPTLPLRPDRVVLEKELGFAFSGLESFSLSISELLDRDGSGDRDREVLFDSSSRTGVGLVGMIGDGGVRSGVLVGPITTIRY